MKKSINLYFSKYNTKFKLNLIKQAGFDGVFTGIEDSLETLSLQNQLLLINEMGLIVSMIHCSYINSKVNDFWLDNESGDKVEKDYINQLHQIGKYNIKNFVIHLSGDYDCVYGSEIGLQRLKNILHVAEIYNINVCIENLHVEPQINYIFENITHKNLKICFDSGHHNLKQTIKSDFLEKYHHHVTCLHLHDNFGDIDEHLPLGFGNINLEQLAKSLAMLDKNIELTCEIKDTFILIDKKMLENVVPTLNFLEQTINITRPNLL